MERETMGSSIARMRKEKGLTQAQLAEMMHVTDKAVSKWERDLSCPDVEALPQLAQIFGITVDELMQAKRPEPKVHKEFHVNLILTAVALAMGVATAVLSILGECDADSGIRMLAIGLACLGISQLKKQ